MNCKTTLRTLAVSTRDTLPADAAAHLQGCPTCAEAWRLDLQIREGLSTLPPGPPAPPDLMFALERHLVERDRPQPFWGRLAAALKPAGPWLVGAVAGLLLGALLSPRPEPAARDADSALLATAFAGLSAGRENAP